MMRTVVTLMLLPCAAPAFAQDTPAQLAKKLGSTNFGERERAAKALEQLGKAAIPALRAAIANADLETQRRAMHIVERIEDRVLLEDLLNATPVHLKFDDVTIEDALRDIEARMGLRTSAVADLRRVAKVDTGRIPYWEAWKRFREAAGLIESDYGSAAAPLRPMKSPEQQNEVPVLGRGDMKGPTFTPPRIQWVKTAAPAWAEDTRHSVRIRARWVRMQHFVDPRLPYAILAFEVRPEPRLEIVNTPRIILEKVVEPNGAEREADPLAMLWGSPPADVERYLLAYCGEIQYGGLLHLKAIPWRSGGTTIRALHGKVRLEAMVRPPLVEAPNVLKSVGQEFRGFHGIVLKVIDADTSDEGDIVVHLRLANIKALTPETVEEQVVRIRPGVVAVRGAIDVALDRLMLVDARGERYVRTKASYQQAKNGDEYDVELHFTPKVGGKDEPTLVLSKRPRAVALDVPFIVCDLVMEAK